MIRDYRDEVEFQLILVDRKNTAPDFSDLQAPVWNLKNNARFLNTMAHQVWRRVESLLEECLEIAREFRPDLVLYDFTALEGRLLGELLGVPSWSSIPGLVGPLMDREYLVASLASDENQSAIADIERRYGYRVDLDAIEIISNCLHMPGERNLLWSYPTITPSDFLAGRQEAVYDFVGYLASRRARADPLPSSPARVYLSFGTEVMDNLWYKHEQTPKLMGEFIAELGLLWRDRDIEMVFTTQGKRVLDTYPANWSVRDSVDQQRALNESHAFITHGGSNSFHEALLYRVPMVVAPFFGDQMLVARTAAALGVGVDMTKDDYLDTDVSKTFLGAEFAHEISHGVTTLLDCSTFRQAFEALELAPTADLSSLLTQGE
jgi:UDP:flavonoid glycosyltransferase YjiC (YdhE family)